MGHLDELQAKYGDRGLVVLAVTNEGKGLVDKFVSDTGAKHPIVIEDGDSAGVYGIRGFPSSFLIDADGKIAWNGHPASVKEDLIERLLENVRLLPELPKGLSSVQKSMEKGDFASARKSLESSLEGGRLSDEERTAAEEAVAWIDARAGSLMASAEADGQRGDWFAVVQTLERVVESFKGLEPAEKAKEQLAEIRKDKDKRREIDAGEVYEKTRQKARSMKPEQAAQMFRMLAKKYDGTKAAEKALADAIRLEAAK